MDYIRAARFRESYGTALICPKCQRIRVGLRNFATLSAVHKKVQGGL